MSRHPNLHWFWQGLISLIFPPRCAICRRLDRSPLCANCGEQIELILPPYCEGCGAPFDPQAQGGELCADCRSGRWHFDQARAMAVYAGPIREGIHRLKYERKQVLGRVFGEMMAMYLRDARSAGASPAASLSKVDAVCPVPLHPARLRERGFNQSEIIARVICERFELPLQDGLLARVRETAPQVSLPAGHRLANVRGAFEVPDRQQVKGKRVLLVDDLMTTGATIDECARVLRRAGAQAVNVVTLARAAADR